MAFLTSNDPAQQNASRRRLYDAMMSRNQRDEPVVEHWMQGVGNVAQAALAGARYKRANAGPTADNAPTDLLSPGMRRQVEGGIPSWPGKIKRGISGLFGGQ